MKKISKNEKLAMLLIGGDCMGEEGNDDGDIPICVPDIEDILFPDDDDSDKPIEIETIYK